MPSTVSGILSVRVQESLPCCAHDLGRRRSAIPVGAAAPPASTAPGGRRLCELARCLKEPGSVASGGLLHAAATCPHLLDTYLQVRQASTWQLPHASLSSSSLVAHPGPAIRVLSCCLLGRHLPWACCRPGQFMHPGGNHTHRSCGWGGCLVWGGVGPHTTCTVSLCPLTAVCVVVSLALISLWCSLFMSLHACCSIR